jgi:hypothetical protein
MVANTAAADEAPPGMTKFNVECPAPRLCKVLEASYLGCLKGLSYSCDTFVDAYWQATPKYDCQRPFDATPTRKYIVPAIWLCGSAEGEQYVNLLARLKTSRAQRLFASPQFRQTLDGALAEEFLDKSLNLEKRMKEANGKARK